MPGLLAVAWVTTLILGAPPPKPPILEVPEGHAWLAPAPHGVTLMQGDPDGDARPLAEIPVVPRQVISFERFGPGYTLTTRDCMWIGVRPDGEFTTVPKPECKPSFRRWEWPPLWAVFGPWLILLPMFSWKWSPLAVDLVSSAGVLALVAVYIM